MIELSKEEKKKIVDYWNKCIKDKNHSGLDLPKIVDHVFPNKNGTTKEGKAVKNFLASKDLKYKAQKPNIREDKVELDDKQKVFISENFDKSSAMELAQILFPDRKIYPNSGELKAIKEFINNEIPQQAKDTGSFEKEEEKNKDNYSSPKSIAGLIPIVNRYCKTSYNKEKDLKEVEKKSLNVLLGHLNGYSFLHKINSYKKYEDRELFQSCFIRYCYDKYDITQEQVDLYLLLCGENVSQDNLKEYEEYLRETLKDKIDSDNTVNAKALTDAINNAQGKLNESTKRIQDLTKYLEAEREKRLKERGSGLADMTKLLEAWQFEKSRENIIKLAQLEKQAENEELERIKSLDDTLILIGGATEEELLHG